MKITTTVVTYGRKLNLQDYNSAHVEVTVTVEHTDQDDPALVTSEAFSHAKLAVIEQLRPLYRKQSEQAEAVFAGLPRELQQEILNANR